MSLRAERPSWAPPGNAVGGNGAGQARAGSCPPSAVARAKAQARPAPPRRKNRPPNAQTSGRRLMSGQTRPTSGPLACLVADSSVALELAGTIVAPTGDDAPGATSCRRLSGAL